MKSTEERLAELESRLEFQDETIAVLSDEVVRHQERMVELEASLQRLVERVQEDADDGDAQQEPPPPHY